MNELSKDDNMIKIFDKIGFFGPFILIIVNILQLWENHGFWYAYLVVTIVSSFLNKIVKNVVKEPRPLDGESIINEEYTGYEMYGMPSAHSQSVFSSVTFLYLVKESPTWLLIGLFIAGLTVYQRLKYKRHTIEQLWVGAILGIMIAYGGFYTTKKYLQENTCVKKTNE